MSKCKHKPVCGASDLLTRTRNGKKMVVIGWRPRAFIPFSSTRGKAPSTEESARHREEQHTPQREGALNMGPYTFTELNQPLSDLLSGGFSNDALNLSRGGAEMWGKRNRVMNTALHTQSILLSSSNGECVQAAGHVTPGRFPLQSCWAGLALRTVFVNVTVILDLLLLSLYSLFVCSFCGFHLKHYLGRF